MQIVQQSRSVPAEQPKSSQQKTTKRMLLFAKNNQSYHSNQNEQDCESIHTTPPSQNIGTDDSIYQQQTNKKKCETCMDNEKILQKMENDLKNQRKKNLRYLKIINAKVDKQKQLQRAYGEIAVELKKKMDQATEINQKLYNYKQGKKKDKIINQLLKKLYETEKSLLQTVDSLQAQKEINQKLMANLQIRQNNKINNNEGDESFGKILNRFYEKEIGDLHKKIFDLQFKLYGADHVSQSIQLFQKPLEQVLTTNSIFRKRGKNSSNLSQQNSISLNKGNKKQQGEQNQHSLSDLFKSLDKIRQDCGRNKKDEKVEKDQKDQKVMNISKISSIQMKNDQSIGENNIYLEGDEFSERNSSKTVKQLQQQSFTSVVNKQHQKISFHSLNNQSQVVQNNSQSEYFSIQQQIEKHKQSMRKSDKNSVGNESFHSIINNSLVSEDYILQKLQIYHQFEFKLNFQKRQQQILQQSSIISNKQIVQNKQNQNWLEEALKFIQNIYLFFIKQGNRVKIITQQSIQQFKQVIMKQKSFEKVQRSFQNSLQMILKMTKRQYQRRLNNKQLQINDIKAKLQAIDSQKGQIQKILQNVQNHNSLLEHKVFQAPSHQPSHQIQFPSQKTIRQSFLRSMIRKKTSILQVNARQKQIQCNIFPSNLMQLYENNKNKYEYTLQIISMVPKFLNSLMQKNNFSIIYQLDTKRDLYEQVDQMFKKCSKLLLINEKNVQSNPSKILGRFRKTSLSIKQRNEKKQQCQKNKDCIHIFQIIQLKQVVKGKEEKIRKLSENNSNSKMQVEALKKKIEQLVKQHEKSEKQTEIVPNNLLGPVKNTLVESVLKKKQSLSGQRQDSFIDYEDNIYFNNVHIQQSSQFGEIKAKLEQCELQLEKWRKQAKKRNKKIKYINN